jgi:hypothetical protein
MSSVRLFLALFFVTSAGCAGKQPTDSRSVRTSFPVGQETCTTTNVDGTVESCPTSSPEIAAGFNLLAPTDFDQTFLVTRRFTSASLSFQFQGLKPASGRNNTYTAMTNNFRPSTAAVATRSPISQFGSAVVSNTGLNTYNVTSKITFNPSKVAVGTYYVYFRAKTNGEDVQNGIYKIVVSN